MQRASAAIIINGATGNILSFSDSLPFITGYTRAELTGAHWDVLHGQQTDKSAALRITRGFCSGHQSYETLLLYTSDQATAFWARVLQHPVGVSNASMPRIATLTLVVITSSEALEPLQKHRMTPLISYVTPPTLHACRSMA